MIKIKFLLKPRTLNWSWLIIDTCIFYHPICWFGKVNSHNDEPERFHKNKPLLVNHFQYLEPEPWFHLFSSAWSSYPRRGTDWFFERTPVDTIAVVQECSHQDMNIPVSGLNMHWQTGWVPGNWKIWKNWRNCCIHLSPGIFLTEGVGPGQKDLRRARASIRQESG